MDTETNLEPEDFAPPGEDGGSLSPEPGDVEGAPAPGVPTREDIRQMVRDRLAAGEVTIDDIVVDMYASQYAIELMLGSFKESFDGFRHSSLGRMLTKRAAKEARRHGNED
jgi:hypothetical protein